MSHRTFDRQLNLFLYDEYSDDSFEELPPEIKAQRDEIQQQAKRNFALQAQFGSYFHQAFAELAEERLVWQVIEFLKKSTPGIMEDESAQNLWEEICVGLRNDSSLSELYIDHIGIVLTQEAGKLTEAERVALWLTTYWGECFLEALPPRVKVPDDIPVNDEEIGKHFESAVLYEAWNNESP